MARNPTDLAFIRVNLVSNATPGTQNNTQVIPASAGIRYRIWLIHLHSSIDANGRHGIGNFHLTVQDGLGNWIGDLLSDLPLPDRLWIPGGLPGAVGQSIRALYRSTLANQTATVQIYYTNEEAI